MDNYKMIQTAKDTATGRIAGAKEITPKDILSKIEKTSGREFYYNGFKDYHGPRELKLKVSY